MRPVAAAKSTAVWLLASCAICAQAAPREIPLEVHSTRESFERALERHLDILLK